MTAGAVVAFALVALVAAGLADVEALPEPEAAEVEGASGFFAVGTLFFFGAAVAFCSPKRKKDYKG